MALSFGTKKFIRSQILKGTYKITINSSQFVFD